MVDRSFDHGQIDHGQFDRSFFDHGQLDRSFLTMVNLTGPWSFRSKDHSVLVRPVAHTNIKTLVSYIVGEIWEI